MNAVQNTPVVTVVDGNVTTLSTDVATFFEKEHSKVIRSIENILSTVSEDRVRNFAQTVVTRSNPSGGAPIKSKAYRLTRDGFTFLAMGFTGARAQEFKWAYIDAFNKMEAALRQCPIATLTVQQRYEIQAEVGKKVKETGRSYADVYQALRTRFKVRKFTEILAKDFDLAISFIRALQPVSAGVLTGKDRAQIAFADRYSEQFSLTSPKAVKNMCPAVAGNVPKTGVRLSYHRTLWLLNLLYVVRFSQREVFKNMIDMLYATQAPCRSEIGGAFDGLSLAMLSTELEDQGYSLKDIDQYRHQLYRRQ